MGVFWKKSTGTAATITMICGLLLGCIGWFFNEILKFMDIQYLYACGIMFIISMIMFILVSILTHADMSDSKNELMWSRAYWNSETISLKNLPWYKNYRYLSVGLIIITMIIIIMWW